MADLLKLRQIRARIARTKARLLRLALFDAFAIPAGILLAFLILTASGGFAVIGAGVRALLVYAFTLAFVIAFVRGLLRFQAPDETQARRLLDESHPERPLSSYQDHPASLTKTTRAYWERHKAHLEQEALKLSPPDFIRDWQKRDPAYLRFLAPLALILICIFSFPALAPRFEAATKPDIGAMFGAESLKISAWIAPPEETGEAPIFLSEDKDALEVPQGSLLTFRVHAPGKPKLKRAALGETKLKGWKSRRFERTEDGAYELKFEIKSPQEIALHYWGKRASWSLDTRADNPPEIKFDDQPVPGKDDMLTFSWSASDDYGVARVSLILEPHEDSGLPVDQSDKIPLDQPAPFSQEVFDTASLDLTRHKWAGLPVRMRLRATDTSGQTAESDSVTYILNEKLFLEPLAKSSQEVRLSLLRENETYGPLSPEAASQAQNGGLGDRLGAAPEGVKHAAIMLEAVTYRPDIFMDDYSIYLGLRRAYEALRVSTSMEDTAPLDDLLWTLALRAEYGTLADAARRLEAARRALEAALRDGASEEEIRRLMEAFREAAEDYIAARMAEAMMNGGQGAEAGTPPDNMLEGQDLQDMLSALEDLTETGATDAARQLLSDVSRLLENLQFQTGGQGGDGMPGEGEDGEGEQSDEEQALQGALDKLADILEEQRRLNDDTLRERMGNGSEASRPNDDGEAQTGNGSEGENGEQNLAERQAELVDQLDAYVDALEGEAGGSGGMSEEDFENAMRALGRAEYALRRGDLDAAQWNQDRAIQEMRDAAGGMAEMLDELKQARLGENGQETNSDEDPLGRPAGGARQDDADSVHIPEEAERQRARDILDELRRRLNESNDPEEREFLKRLLDRF